jgi:hypothetical protein
MRVFGNSRNGSPGESGIVGDGEEGGEGGGFVNSIAGTGLGM